MDVRRTASLPLAYDRASQYSKASKIEPRAAAYKFARSAMTDMRARLFSIVPLIAARILRAGGARFEQFLKQSPATAATLRSDADKEALFKQFQSWEAEQNAKAQARPAPAPAPAPQR